MHRAQDGFPLAGLFMLRCSIHIGRAREREKTMFDRLKSALRSLRIPSAADLEERYLAESTSLVDLERRQRQLDLARIGKAPQPW